MAALLVLMRQPHLHLATCVLYFLFLEPKADVFANPLVHLLCLQDNAQMYTSIVYAFAAAVKVLNPSYICILCGGSTAGWE